MCKKLFYGASILLIIAFLHGGAVLKSEDPIADTQTDPISYDQKMEQDKDGVKAAASPKMIYYGGQGFLTRSSLSKYEKEIAVASAGKKKEKFNWSDWWEDDQSAASAPSSDSEGAELKDADEVPQKVHPKGGAADEETRSLDTPLQEKVVHSSDNSNSALSLPPPEPNKKSGDDWW